jgi:hypothetical protein
MTEATSFKQEFENYRKIKDQQKANLEERFLSCEDVRGYDERI